MIRREFVHCDHVPPRYKSFYVKKLFKHKEPPYKQNRKKKNFEMKEIKLLYISEESSEPRGMRKVTAGMTESKVMFQLN